MSDIDNVTQMRPPGAGGPSNPKSDAAARVERVYKFFSPAEAIRVIKSQEVRVTIGSPPEQREVIIKPLSPRGLAAAYNLIREILLPLLSLFRSGESPSVGDLVEALGPNIDKVPELVHVILSRGNTISKDWIEDNLDILLDLQLILPAFIEQNALDKLFSPKSKSDDQTSTASPTQTETPTTGE